MRGTFLALRVLEAGGGRSDQLFGLNAAQAGAAVGLIKRSLTCGRTLRGIGVAKALVAKCGVWVPNLHATLLFRTTNALPTTFFGSLVTPLESAQTLCRISWHLLR
jgi:hypothetical protein